MCTCPTPHTTRTYTQHNASTHSHRRNNHIHVYMYTPINLHVPAALARCSAEQVDRKAFSSAPDPKLRSTNIHTTVFYNCVSNVKAEVASDCQEEHRIHRWGENYALYTVVYLSRYARSANHAHYSQPVHLRIALPPITHAWCLTLHCMSLQAARLLVNQGAQYTVCAISCTSVHNWTVRTYEQREICILS